MSFVCYDRESYEIYSRALSEAEIAGIRTWIESEDRKPPVTEPDVAAILSAKCWVCHGRREQMGGLDLRTRQSMLRGGKSGPAIVPGKPESSLLVKRIAGQEMPPPKLQEQYSVRGLTDDELAKVRQWIADGALAGDQKPLEVSVSNDPAIKPADREFWAFRAPERPLLPRPSQLMLLTVVVAELQVSLSTLEQLRQPLVARLQS